MCKISTNGLLWESVDGFRIRSLADVRTFLVDRLKTKNALIQFKEKDGLIYQLRKEDVQWHLYCMIDVCNSGLYAEHDTYSDLEGICKYIYKRRKAFNDYFFTRE